MLKRLIYGSKAIHANPANLRAILTVSRSKNPKAGITGALCLLDGIYLQYIEGEERAVEALYARIETDDRHLAPVVLDRTFIAVREFPRWSMALLHRDERIKALMGLQDREAPGAAIYGIVPARACTVFRALSATPNWIAL